MPQKISNQSIPEPYLDERLLRLGREWFAEVRREHPDDSPRRRWGDSGDAVGSEGIGSLFDSDGGDSGD